MQRWALMFAAVFGLLLPLGCAREAELPASKPRATAPAARPRPAAAPKAPKLGGSVEITDLWNGRAEGGFNGWIGVGANGEAYPTGRVTWGLEGRKADISWTFVEQRDGADVYLFTRTVPVDNPPSHTSQKRIRYTGEEVEVFADEFQRVAIVPLPATASTPGP